MNTASLFKMRKADLGNSNCIKENANYSTSISKIFEEIYAPAIITLRYYQKSISELSKLTEGYELKIDQNRFEIINEYQQDNIRSRNVGYFDDLNIPVDVSMGQIELSVADLLAIERGDSIMSKLQPCSKVTLLIAGEAIAEASFEIEEETIVLKINETYLEKINEPSDNSKVMTI